MSTPPEHPERPNFFVLLSLDPDAPWNQAEFEVLLKDKRIQWARETNSPIKEVKNAASSNLRLVGKIKEVMENDAKRHEEAMAARAQNAAQEAARKAELSASLNFAIELYQTKPSISPTVFAELVKEYSAIISESDLKTRLAIPIQEDDEQAGSAAPERLDPTNARRIRDDLAFLDESSLYTLLRTEAARGPNPPAQPLGPESASLTLLEAAKELHNRMLAHPDKGPENTARKNLAGEALVIFQSEEMRRKYDTTLRLEPLDRLLKDIERLCRSDGRVTAPQAELFLRKAREKGVPIPDAEAALTRLIQEKKWPQIVLTETVAAVNHLHACPKCNHLNGPADKFCERCGEPLWLDCPDCGAKGIDANALACGVCGFQLKLRTAVVWELDETERLIKVGDWLAAAAQLDEARREWTPKHADTLVERMNALNATIEPKRKEIEEARRIQEEARRAEEQRLAQIRRQQEEKERLEREALEKEIEAIKSSIQELRLYRARQQLDAMLVDFPEKSMYRSDINEGIANAERLVREARAAQTHGDTSKAAEIYKQVLTVVCADSREAHDGLRDLPLAAAENLRMQYVKDQSDSVDSWRVKLWWDPSPDADADTTYWVSKSLMPLTRDNPGDLKVIQGVTWTDYHPELGATTYYSVVAESNGRRSGAISDHLLVAAPVANLECEVAPREIRLRWTATSPHLRGVCLRRAENAPPRDVTEGIEIAITSPASAKDTDVRAGTLYGYSVFAQYVDVHGNTIWSPPATIQATPQTAPSYITDLRAEQREDQIAYAVAILQWSAPTTGEVTIIRYDDAQYVPEPRSLRRWDRLIGHGRQLTGHTPPLKDTWIRPGICWYAPITRLGEMGYVGDPELFKCIQNVAVTPAKFSSDRVQLGWTWAHDCTRVVVAYSPTDWPSTTSNITPVSVGRNGAADGTSGSYEAPQTGSREAFFVVTAYTRYGDSELASPSNRYRASVGQKPQLSSRVVKGFRSHAIELRMHHSKVAPALVVVSRSDAPPASPTDGIARYRQEGKVWEKGIFSVPGSGQIPRDHFVGIFLTDEGERAAVEIVNQFFQMP